MSEASPPNIAQWPRPAITFETADVRDDFEAILTHYRDYLHSLQNAGADEFRPAHSQALTTVESILRDMGAEMDDTAEYVFETPAELNVAIRAAEVFWQAIEVDDEYTTDEKADRRERVADIAATLTQAHWDDDIVDELGAMTDE